MKTVFHLIIAAAVLCGTSIQAKATSIAEAVEAFSIMPMIRSVSVSPDGKQLAVVRASTKNGDYYIEIRQISDLTKVIFRKLLMGEISSRDFSHPEIL